MVILGTTYHAIMIPTLCIRAELLLCFASGSGLYDMSNSTETAGKPKMLHLNA